MEKLQNMLDGYARGVQFPDTSGFEVLELLDLRSQLAGRESELNGKQREQVEGADEV